MRNFSSAKVIFFDADGVLYHGLRPVKGAAETFAKIQQSGRKAFILTNNSSQSRWKVASKLRKMGFKISYTQIISTAYLLARYLKDNEKRFKGKTIFLIGRPSIIAEARSLGIQARFIRDPKTKERIDIVVVGLDKSLTYAKIAKAMHALQSGAFFIATNLEKTLPTETGFLPGTGIGVMAVSLSAGREPDVVLGKPAPMMMRLALEIAKCEPKDALMVGDRFDTDIAAAKRAAIRSILVLSGETSPAHAKVGKPRPDAIIADVNGLRSVLDL